jgi:hypothetical protein
VQRPLGRVVEAASDRGVGCHRQNVPR